MTGGFSFLKISHDRHIIGIQLEHPFAVKLSKESVRLLVSAPAQYAVRLARSPAEITAAQELRFQVFNLELNEGLAQSYVTGRDADPYDAVCDHLIDRKSVV